MSFNPLRFLREAFASAAHDVCPRKEVKELPPSKRYIESDMVKDFEKFVAEKKKNEQP